MSMRPPRRCRGFTLLEVMVAMAVLGLAMLALIETGGNSAASLDRLRDKTLAQWVAMNVLAESQLEQEAAKPGTRNGTASMAARDWYWSVVSKTTPDADVLRLEVEVRREKQDEAPLIRLVGLRAIEGDRKIEPVVYQ